MQMLRYVYTKYKGSNYIATIPCLRFDYAQYKKYRMIKIKILCILISRQSSVSSPQFEDRAIYVDIVL